jgi:hypothetical protein
MPYFTSDLRDLKAIADRIHQTLQQNTPPTVRELIAHVGRRKAVRDGIEYEITVEKVNPRKEELCR